MTTGSGYARRVGDADGDGDKIPVRLSTQVRKATASRPSRPGNAREIASTYVDLRVYSADNRDLPGRASLRRAQAAPVARRVRPGHAPGRGAVGIAGGRVPHPGARGAVPP